MTDTVPFITLTKENFAEFQRQVYDYASSICLDNGFLTHRHGLLSFVVTTEIWQNLPGNGIPDDAVPPNIVFRPRDILTPPEIPAENANAWRVFDYRTKEFDKVAVAVLLLTRRLKDALPASDRSELSDPILGMGQLTALQLMTHLRTQYGTLTSEDYKALHAQLTHKLDSATNFTGFAADQRFIFEQLAAYGQPIPELQKCDFLRSGTCHLFPVQKAIESYLTAHPHTANQTFHNLVTHITLHSPNFSQSAGDMGYTAAATHITPSSTSEISSTVATLLLSPTFLAALATAAAAAAISPPPRSPRPPRANRGGQHKASNPPTTDSPRSYCYAHGYDGHSSAACYKMRYGSLAKNYSDDARLATNHTSVSGGSTLRL